MPIHKKKYDPNKINLGHYLTQKFKPMSLGSIMYNQ